MAAANAQAWLPHSTYELKASSMLMQALVAPTQIDTAVARLDAWLDTIYGPGGYGGPVAHWWRQSLLYTGAGLDWRYEGIIAGYLALWRRSGNMRWLLKARRAGDDLLAGQLANGHYAGSAFEINPASAGTPHEAAVDVGLLMLAQTLRSAHQTGWERYAVAAERNLHSFYIDALWDSDARAFRDDSRTPTFVPNKAATACDALFLLAELRGDAELIERYALPTLDRIIRHQVRGGSLDGAIAQNSFGSRVIHKYIPIYIARCVSALLRGLRWSGDGRYAECALRAMRFVARRVNADGALPTVVYANGRINRYPCWIAPLGDVLRARDELQPYGFPADFSAVEQRLLAGQDWSGGIQTATGFAAQAGGRPGPLPDVRDLLHVAGWCDKAFRYLAEHTQSELPDAINAPFESPCVLQGHTLYLHETADVLEISEDGVVVYRWRKGSKWAEVASPIFWLE